MFWLISKQPIFITDNKLCVTDNAAKPQSWQVTAYIEYLELFYFNVYGEGRGGVHLKKIKCSPMGE